jgi:hypothetical protein
MPRKETKKIVEFLKKEKPKNNTLQKCREEVRKERECILNFSRVMFKN